MPGCSPGRRAPGAPTPRARSPPPSCASRRGCGECLACRTALAGSHADVTAGRHRPVGHQGRPDARAGPAGRPGAGRPALADLRDHEDADRLNDKAADALLKSIEEPPPRTVWLLCAPTVEDVVPTIRSRCRTLVLRTPPTEAVAAHLKERDGVERAVAIFAARASQGHIGRARALARRRGHPQPPPRGAPGAAASWSTSARA